MLAQSAPTLTIIPNRVRGYSAAKPSDQRRGVDDERCTVQALGVGDRAFTPSVCAPLRAATHLAGGKDRHRLRPGSETYWIQPSTLN